MKKIVKIVLTGGSCARKTSAQKYLITNLNSDIATLIVPEAASILLANGVCRDEITTYSFQNSIFSIQKNLERTFENIANEINRNVLIICDRGTCEGKAFLSKSEWIRLLTTNNTTFESELNSYYAVIFMPSVSVDYPNLYLNTPIRNYTLSNAKMENEKIYNIWKNHKNFHTISSYSDFNMKLKEVLEKVKEIIHEV